MLLGLTRPTTGKPQFSGRMLPKTAWPCGGIVGYLAQDPRYYEHMTARQTLRFTARFFYSGPRDLIEARVDEMLEPDRPDRQSRPTRSAAFPAANASDWELPRRRSTTRT